jgi:type II secretory pathway pseudopilin PulG
VKRTGGSNSKRGKRAGFTIVEVVIASAVLFMISGGFILSYLSAMRTHLMARDYYRATCMARNRLQRAHALDYGSLPLLDEDMTPVDELGNADPAGVFRRTTAVTNLVPTCTRLAVTVHYPVRNGALSPEPVEVATMITEGI